MTEELLKVEDLSVQYQGLHTANAVNHISFSIMPHETIGLVGETGAGKTTTALSILRLLPQRTGKITSGHIYYRGKDLLQLSEKEMQAIRGSEISMIFQDPMTSLNPVLTVGKQIEESFIFHNEAGLTKEEIDGKVDDLLRLVGIEPSRRDDYPHQFSGGMKQRVVIAMALACQPQLLIADEPTTALDVTIQAQVINMMMELQKKNQTATILITHDLGVVAKMCSKVAVIYAGEIVEMGGIRDILSGDWHHPYLTGLLGSIPSIRKKIERLKPVDGLMPDPSNLPAGCKFHPRCAQCTERCRTEEPPVYMQGDHMVKCFAAEVDHG